MLLQEADVEWREQRQSRPWLAGMIKTNNHALLDVDALLTDH